MKLNFSSFFRKFLFKRKSNNLPQKAINNIKRLIKEASIQAVNPEIYVTALTHRSFLEIEPQIKQSNQRLEYLGDAVLGLITADYLYNKYPNEDEGFLTKSRSNLVKKDALLYFARKLSLEKYILYDKRFIGKEETGFQSIEVDCMEALIGAIYLDTGFKNAGKFVVKNIIEPGLETGILNRDTNYKGRLLELLHQRKMPLPVYNILSEKGAEHNKTFTIAVEINGKKFGVGKGRSKKTAEQRAAQKALKRLL